MAAAVPACARRARSSCSAKRISDRLTLGYEQGLSIAANALRLEYSLSNTLTLRAEAGTVSGVGVYYRRTYD